MWHMFVSRIDAVIGGAGGLLARSVEMEDWSQSTVSLLLLPQLPLLPFPSVFWLRKSKKSEL
jgi:hypothetical protein